MPAPSRTLVIDAVLLVGDVLVVKGGREPYFLRAHSMPGVPSAPFQLQSPAHVTLRPFLSLTRPLLPVSEDERGLSWGLLGT